MKWFNTLLCLALFTSNSLAAKVDPLRVGVQISAWNISWGDYSDYQEYHYNEGNINANRFNDLQFGPLPCLTLELDIPLRQSQLRGDLAFWTTGGSVRHAPNTITSIENSILALGLQVGLSYPFPVRKVTFLPTISAQFALVDWTTTYDANGILGYQGEFNSIAFGFGLGSKILFPITSKLDMGVHVDMILLPANGYTGSQRSQLLNGNWGSWDNDAELVASENNSYLGPDRNNNNDHSANIGISGAKLGLLFFYEI